MVQADKLMEASWGFVLTRVIFATIATLLLIFTLSGSYQKSIKNYLKLHNNSDMAMEKVENFFQNTPMVNGLCYNSEFISGQANATTAFGEINKLVWVYLHTVTHKRYLITVGKTYSLMLCFTDGSRQEVIMKKEEHAYEHMQQLAMSCPHTIFGYTDELDTMFRKDMSAFLNIKYNQNVNNI